MDIFFCLMKHQTVNYIPTCRIMTGLPNKSLFLNITGKVLWVLKPVPFKNCDTFDNPFIVKQIKPASELLIGPDITQSELNVQLIILIGRLANQFKIN